MSVAAFVFKSSIASRFLFVPPGIGVSSRFRPLRALRGLIYLPAVLVCLAVLLAASPARAQSPAILLDIKSPATASPPNESLLTLNDAGDLWIKGHLYDCPFQSTITLDPAKKYWTLREAAGKIVWALEVHSPATGISTGDLYSIGFLRSWSSNPDQPNALARYFNSSGQVVFSVDAAGNGLSAGITPAAEPPKTKWESMSPSLDGYVVPEPFPQGRIYCWRPGGNFDVPTLVNHDVSGTEWRLRYDPSKGQCSLIDYGVCWGFRYWFALEAEGKMTYMRFSYNSSTHTWGNGGPYGGEEDTLLYLGEDNKIHPDYSFTFPDWDWSVSAFPTVPADRSKPIPISLTMTDQPPSTLDPDPPFHNGGNLTDSCGATADSLLYLYDVQFTTRPLPTAIPRKGGDPAVAVGCRLRPQNTPGFSHMELTVWDPAYLDYYGFPLFMKIFSSTSPSFSQSWDGKLYLDGDEYSFDEYTQASDIFMSAVVYWNRSNPPKPWETELDAFDEPRVAFTVTGTPAITSNTLEVGSEYTFSTVTNALPVPIVSYQWDFEGKAFQPVDQDRYNAAHLLTTAQKTSATVTTKFITGWKSSVSNTDLGTRTVQLTVTDTSGTLRTSTLRPNVMVHRSNSVRAKITFYHLAYEAQSVFSNGPYSTSISMFDPVTQTTRQYYFGEDFTLQIRKQGTGVPHKLRTQSGLTKEQGDDPLPQQRYIMYAPNPGTYSFSAAPRVVSQDGAHFYWDGNDEQQPPQPHNHRSYFNRGVAYEVTNVFCPACPDYPTAQTYSSLAELVNARRGDFTEGDVPMQFTGSEITINDAGTFDKWQYRDIDEKHIDVFLQETGNQGINQQQIFDRLGTVWATVRNP